MKGYKLWNPVTKKNVYSRDVMFRQIREVEEVPIHEVTPMEKEPEKIDFELEGEESDSVEEDESEEEDELEEEEPHTQVLRRSS